MIASVVFFSILCLFLAGGQKPGRKYCQPSESCWPTEEELVTFSDGLDGTLITPSSPQYFNATLINNRRFIELPGVIVEVASSNDVVLSLQFARDHDLRVSIVSTGHDYDGRNSGNATLQLSFKMMKRISLVDGDQNIRVETGNTWGDVHTFMKENKREKIVIGGSDPSVGVGGWVLGGGHSPFSSMSGLGVDNVVSFDMVLANGTTITANNNENTEIFWALRGGGGGTFGVVLNITYKLHDNPGPVHQLVQAFPLDNVTGLPSLKVFSKWLSAASSNVSGYLLMVNYPQAGFLWSVLYRGKYEDALREVKPLIVLPYAYITGRNFTDAYEYYATVMPDLGGSSVYTFSSFFGDESLAMGESLTTAFQYLTSPMYQVYRSCTGTILGGAVATAGKISGATAIHPGFRSARMALTCAAGWSPPGEIPTYEHMADDWAASLNKYGDGHYFNEPQSNLMDWKTGFWGSLEMYNQLLKVKNTIDPDYLFNCHHCVGYSD